MLAWSCATSPFLMSSSMLAWMTAWSAMISEASPDARPSRPAR